MPSRLKPRPWSCASKLYRSWYKRSGFSIRSRSARWHAIAVLREVCLIAASPPWWSPSACIAMTRESRSGARPIFSIYGKIDSVGVVTTPASIKTILLPRKDTAVNSDPENRLDLVDARIDLHFSGGLHQHCINEKRRLLRMQVAAYRLNQTALDGDGKQ